MTKVIEEPTIISRLGCVNGGVRSRNLAYMLKKHVLLGEVPRCEIWRLLRQALSAARCPLASSLAAAGDDFLTPIGVAASDLMDGRENERPIYCELMYENVCTKFLL